MKYTKHLFFTIITALLSVFLPGAYAQNIMKGRVQESENKLPILGVYIVNIHTNKAVMTDSSGNFELEVFPDNQVEIQKITYKTIKLRVPKSTLAGFYVLDMDYDSGDIDQDSLMYYINKKPDFFTEREKNAEMYRVYLNHYRKEDLNPLANPFDFISKRNKQIWAFQKAFDYWEKEKFIDFVFNDKLILQVTDLNEEALAEFKRLYRPTYEMIKSFQSDYDYYLYIKMSSQYFLRDASQRYYRR